MKIKKVDDKPMVIHTKKKAKLHTHEPKKASVKAANIYTVERNSKNKNSSGEFGGNKKYRKSTIHKTDKENKGMFFKYRMAAKESKQSIKTKDSSIKLAGAVTTQTALSNMEGGDEIRDATEIAYAASRPVTGTASKGAEMYRRKAAMKTKSRIKKIEAGSNLSKAGKSVTENVTDEVENYMDKSKSVSSHRNKGSSHIKTRESGNTAGIKRDSVISVKGKTAGKKIDKADSKRNSRNRKIRFFLDKLKSEQDQQDSVKQMATDILKGKAFLMAKKIIAAIAPLLLGLVLLIAVVTIPVVAVIAVLYNSPFAFFLPPLEAGDTVTSVTSAYVSEFNREVNDLITAHTGCDTGQIVYVDYEGIGAPSNFNDIIAVYMVKHGVEDTATVMNTTSKGWLQTVVDDMCSYTTSTGSETVATANGGSVTQTVYYVNVSYKYADDMVSEYGFNANEQELLSQMMSMFYSSSGVTPQSSLTQTEIDEIMQGITDSTQRAVVSFALTNVGYPYSQQYRDSGSYFDCSSLAYYSWQAAGKDISYGGAYSAAAEAEGLESAGYAVSYDDMQPGDLIFYSYERNGRYKNISHVAVYVGNGMVVEAKGAAYGVTYNTVPNVGNIVVIGRPQ